MTWESHDGRDNRSKERTKRAHQRNGHRMKRDGGGMGRRRQRNVRLPVTGYRRYNATEQCRNGQQVAKRSGGG